LESWEPFQHLLLGKGKPRKTCSPTDNSKTVSFTIGKEATITYDLYSHNTLAVPFHLSSALFRQKSSALNMMSVKWKTKS